MHYILIIILVLLGIWLIFWLLKALFTGLITTLAIVGSAVIMVFDYFARPLTWLGLHSPDLNWAVIGALLGGCLGLFLAARSVAPATDFRKILIGIAVGLGVGLTAVVLSYSNQNRLGLVGDWRGDISIGEKNMPATLTIEQERNSSIYGALGVAFPGSAGYRIAVTGSITPGTNELSLQENQIIAVPKGQEWQLGSSVGSIALGLNRMSGQGEKSKGNGKGIDQYFWSFSRGEEAEPVASGASSAAGPANASSPGKAVQNDNAIKLDGSRAVAAIAEAVVEELQKPGGGKEITVGVSGTSGGFTKFCNSETVIATASRPINATEIAACETKGIEYVELPIAYDALAVVVNPENNWIEKLTLAELKKIWEPAAQGKLKGWNQIRSSWPDQPISLYGPNKTLREFDYLTEVVIGKPGASRQDYSASGNSEVIVQKIAENPNALGYLNFVNYEANQRRLQSVPIDHSNGATVPTRQTIESGEYYPLSRPLLIYINTKSAKSAEVKQIVDRFLSSADLISQVGYLPLPDEAYKLAGDRFKQAKAGSIFTENTSNISVVELLRSQK
jgi:phosphate transport system substrate-binding protein